MKTSKIMYNYACKTLDIRKNLTSLADFLKELSASIKLISYILKTSIHKIGQLKVNFGKKFKALSSCDQIFRNLKVRH